MTGAELRKAQDGQMYTESDFLAFYGETMGRSLWNLAGTDEQASTTGAIRTARAATDLDEDSQITLKLELPDGEVECITVGASKDGVAVLMRLTQLIKKHECLRHLGEDPEFIMPNGQLLQLVESVAAQGLVEGDKLRVRGSASGETSETTTEEEED